MTATGNKRTVRKSNNNNSAARKKSPRRRSQAANAQEPPTLTGDHARGFSTGLFCGLLLGAAGMLWLTRETELEHPVPVAKDERPASEVTKPRFDFFTVLPEEDLNLADSAQFQPRSNDAAGSSYSDYILQAGSFRRMEDADRRKGELALLGLESNIEQANGENGRWWRVYVGPFESRSAMMRARGLAAQGDIDTLLLKRGN